MSGTSLDGLDLCYCNFNLSNNTWSYELIHSATYKYSADWINILSKLIFLKDSELSDIDKKYTHLLSNLITKFISDFNIIDIDFVSSHGHTAMHEPNKNFTYQIGNLPILSSLVNLPIVCDFRVQDVEYGGQGAPLVPVGDKFLFSQYDYCLNLGGFSNISFIEKGVSYAYDISPFNTVLNGLSNKLGYCFDDGGETAKSGQIIEPLLTELNSINYYKEIYPKSLGVEFVNSIFNPILNKYDVSIKDKLRTCVEHFAFQISYNIKSNSSVLITGGGAFNTFFISILKSNYNINIHIPNKEIVEFKEALIFAFLGVLRMRNQNNCLSSVTGAYKDHSSGKIYYPKKSIS